MDVIEHHLTKRASVGNHVDVVRTFGANVNVGCTHEREPIVDDRANRVTQIERLLPQPRHPAFGAREMQNVLDEVHQAPAFLHDHISRRSALAVAADAPEIERFGEQQDLRQWRPELVRHARDEISAQPRELVLATQLHHGDDDHRRREHEKSDEPRHTRLGNRSEREQFDGTRADRHMRRERPGLIERRRRRIGEPCTPRD